MDTLCHSATPMQSKHYIFPSHASSTVNFAGHSLLVRTHKTMKKMLVCFCFGRGVALGQSVLETVYAQTLGQSDQMAWNRWDTSRLMY